jgi:hypothetical protein
VQAAKHGYKAVLEAAKRENLLMQADFRELSAELPNNDGIRRYQTDETAHRLARRHGIPGRPVVTPGDGSCLFHAISIAATAPVPQTAARNCGI